MFSSERIWQLADAAQSCTSDQSDDAQGDIDPLAEGQGFPFTVPEQPMMMADTAPLKTTDYLVLILLSSIPVVGLILLLVWALSTTENVNRRNFCRAQLIWMGISVAVSILFMIVYGIIFAAAFESIGTADVFTHSFPGMIFR